MPGEIFVLIPGRTARQGTSLNVGKGSAEYREETSTVLVSSQDMVRLGLVEGESVRLRSATGVAQFVTKRASADEVPPGLLFVPYGPSTCPLIGGETHGSGMPDSKGIDVYLEKITHTP